MTIVTKIYRKGDTKQPILHRKIIKQLGKSLKDAKEREILNSLESITSIGNDESCVGGDLCV